MLIDALILTAAVATVIFALLLIGWVLWHLAWQSAGLVLHLLDRLYRFCIARD